MADLPSKQDSTELYYAEMEAARNTAEAAYFTARPLLNEGPPVETFRAGFERAFRLLWKPTAAETSDARVANLLRALDAKQAKIDALMLEFCPGEMSAEQRAEWEKHQRPLSADEERSITDAFSRSPRRVTVKAPAPQFKPGDRVCIPETGTTGTVLTVGDIRAQVQYDHGPIREPLLSILVPAPKTSAAATTARHRGDEIDPKLAQQAWYHVQQEALTNGEMALKDAIVKIWTRLTPVLEVLPTVAKDPQ